MRASAWWRTAAGVASIAGLLSACGVVDQGRAFLRVESPVGGVAAEVREHLALDGPRQTLWLSASAAATPVKIAALGEDTHWCDQIVWRPDGERVGFLINRSRFDVFAVDGAAVATIALVEIGGDSGRREARDLTWGADGVLEYDDCFRDAEECDPGRRVTLP